MRRKFRRPELIFDEALGRYLVTEGHTLVGDVSERSTCGRLAIYLQAQLQCDGVEGYFADVEYNRKQDGKVKTIINSELEVIKITTDLIVHTRGDRPPPFDNLIAVEVKKSSRPVSEKDADRNRLVALTMVPFDGVWPWDGSHPEHVCGYSVGIYLEIDIGKRTISLEYYKKGAVTKSRSIVF